MQRSPAPDGMPEALDFISPAEHPEAYVDLELLASSPYVDFLSTATEPSRGQSTTACSSRT